MASTHWGVRWNRLSVFAVLERVAVIWVAEEPVPITPTRRPSSGAS